MQSWHLEFNPHIESTLGSIVKSASNPKSLEAIGDVLGNIVSLCKAFKAKYSTTFAHLCIYADLSKGLSNQIVL
jgi:hypothetical protein